MVKVNAHMAEKAWNPALRTANLARKYVKDKSQKNQLRGVYNKLDSEGQELLKKYQEAFDRKAYLEAIEGYEDICCTFGHLPCAVAAEEALRQIESIPEAKSILQDRKARKLEDLIESTLSGNPPKEDEACPPSGELVPDEGLSDADGEKDKPSPDPKSQLSRIEKIKSLSVAKQAKIMELMERAVNLYPLSQVGKRAADDLKVLRKDKAFQSRLKEYVRMREAERLYKLGETYRKSHLIPEALKCYRQVVQKFPGTKVAEKAKVRVDSLAEK